VSFCRGRDEHPKVAAAGGRVRKESAKRRQKLHINNNEKMRIIQMGLLDYL